MKKRVLSIVLAMALCLTLLPTAAWAEEPDAEPGGTEQGVLSEAEPETEVWTVTAFDELAENVASQTLPQRAEDGEDEGPNLPDTLGATAYQGEDAPQTVTIEGVTWEADSDFDQTAPGEYVYTSVLPKEYALVKDVALPTITVTVEAAPDLEGEPPQDTPPAAVWTVTAFEALAEDVARQTLPQLAEGSEDEGPNLPYTLRATAYQEDEDNAQTVTIDGVTWEADPAFDPSTPGDYVYTPALPEGYELAEGAVPPTITVTVAYDIESAVTIFDIPDQTYTGSEIKPDVTIQDGDTTLIENTDYTVTYSDNINAGTATVTVTGINHYTGTVTTTFHIMQKQLAAPIKLGDYVQMGTYDTDGDGTAEPILWRCVAFEKISGYDEDGNPITDSTDTVTEYRDGYLPLMLADTSICKKEFDAAGSVMTGSHSRDNANSSRQTNGSNYWGDSNIRDWLNSSESAGNVEWTCGNPPSYKDEAGFLTSFTDAEKTAIKTVTQKSLLSNYDTELNTVEGASAVHTHSDSIGSVVQNYATAYAENITDTMFLLDVQQVYNVYANDSSLGNSYYKNAVAGYWLRSPYTIRSGSDSARGVAPTGSVLAYYDINDFGVRPAFYLNQQSVIFTSGDGKSENPYSTIPDQSYTGSEIKPDVTIQDGEATLVEGTDYTVTYFNNINAGTATVTITGMGNYTGTATAGFAIKKADISPVVSMDGWTYGETAKEPSVSGNSGEGTVTYQYKVSGADDSDYSDTVPSNAGTYTVKATVAETDNYNSGTATTEFTIAKAGSQTTAENQTVTYGETLTLAANVSKQLSALNSLSLFSVDADTVEFYVVKDGQETSLGTAEVTYDDDTAKDSGTATLTITTVNTQLAIGDNTITAVYGGSINLNSSDNDSITVTLNQKQVGLTWSGYENLVYDGTAKSVTATATGIEEGDSVTVTVTGGTETNAGTYTATAVLTGTGAGYYKLPEAATQSYTISKASVTAPTITNKVYTGETLTADVAASDIYSVSANDGGVNVGEYDVVLTLADSNNYTWPDSDDAAKTLKFNITQAANEWTTEPSIASVTYGTAVSPLGAAKFGDVSVTYAGTDDTSYEESATAPTAAGSYTAKFRVAGTDNYTELSTNAGFTIAKAGSQTEVEANQAVTYGEMLTLTANVSKQLSAINSLSLFSVDNDTAEFYVGDTLLGTAEVIYDDDTAKDSGTATLTINTADKQLAIGVNTITVVYGGSNALNGNTATVSITLKPKEVTAEVTNTITKAYDGTASATVELEVKDSDLVNSTDSITVTGTGAYASTGAAESIAVTVNDIQTGGADAAFYTVSAPTDVTGEITAATITSQPQISGEAVYGQTLTAAYTPATGETVTFQWNRDGEAISGATGTTYTVAAADVGCAITVTAMATDSNHTGSTTSQSVAAGKAGQTAPSAAPELASRTTSSITLKEIKANANGAAAEYGISTDGGET